MGTKAICTQDSRTGYYEDPEDYEIGDMDEYYDEYIPSSSAGDYSPSNPWDALGMSKRDFYIRGCQMKKFIKASNFDESAQKLQDRVVSCINQMNKVELKVYGRLRNMPVENWEAYLEGFLDYEEYTGLSVSKAPNILNFFNICMEHGFNAVSQSINSYHRKLYS